MSSEESLSVLIERLARGSDSAAHQIWERFFPRLVNLARVKLQGSPARVADEEDVVLSALNSFFEGVKDGEFPELDSEGLWFLLAKITARKAIGLQIKQRAQKRGGGLVRGESVFIEGQDPTAGGMSQMIHDDATPDFLSSMDEQLRELLNRLGDQGLRRVAVWRMEGYNNAEIAEQLGVSTRSVERKLRMIRKHWAAEMGDG